MVPFFDDQIDPIVWTKRVDYDFDRQGWINLRDATLSTFPFIAHQMESISSPTRSIEAAMDIISGTSVTALLLLLYCLCFQFCTATNTITSTQFIKDPEIMVSNGSLFKMGFFSPGNSTKRYFGIWYNTTSLFTVIWISNRENPLNDSSGVVMVSEDGQKQWKDHMAEFPAPFSRLFAEDAAE